MSQPVNAPACQNCMQTKGRQYFLIPDAAKIKDAEGYRCTVWTCPGCGARGAARDVVSLPPCENCGHQKRSYARDGVEDTYRPGMGAIKDGKAFLDMMKGQSIPGAG